MKKKLMCMSLVLILCVALASCSSEEKYEVSDDLQKKYDSFIDAVDPKVGYDVAVELTENEAFRSSSWGDRTAGSDAEHAAAAWLSKQMKEIGLEDVEKVGADCDKWENKSASFQIKGDKKKIKPHSYATAATPKKGVNAEVVYVKKGTMYDYEKVDVKGKIVLVDIDQRSDWWITYPMLEAKFQGAAAIMSANTGGFSQVNKDALNAQDICAGTGIPCVSISINDSNYIKEKLKKGKVKANLKVDTTVEVGKGTTYNVMGKIKGKSSDQQIIVGAHYDMHFNGFQDDNCAAGLVLAMAKAMKASGYTPENDIIFCLHGAEEWGSSYTQYDWTVGAWEMINKKYPKWQEKTRAFINFELPAYEFDKYTSTYSAPEMYKMIDFFANTYPLSPEPEGCFEDGIKTEGYQTYTYSDDFSYYAAGVPSTVNGFLLQENMEDVFPFYVDYYHSQFDNKDTYNEKVMDFNIKYYGAMAMYIDQTPALYLDYTAQYDRLKAAINEEVMTEAGADLEGYKAALEEMNTSAKAMTEEIKKINDSYMKAKMEGDTKTAKKLWKEGMELTQKNLRVFNFVQDEFLGLMYEKPVVPHEAPQENIHLINQTVKALKAGDVKTAADEHAYQINNVMEWYSMYFSPEVIAVQDDMFWGKDNQDNLYWGTGKSFLKANVEKASRSLIKKYDQKDPDLHKEIAIYEKVLKPQKKELVKRVEQEIDALKDLNKQLKM